MRALVVFGLPVAQPDGAGEVGLERAAREDGIGERGAGGGGGDVRGEAREGAVLDGEVGDLGVGGDAGSAELAGDGGVDGGGRRCSRATGRSPAIGRRSLRSRETMRAWICWPRAPERSTRVWGSWRKDWPSMDGVGAAVVVDVELAGDGHAAASGSDAEVGARDEGVRCS